MTRDGDLCGAPIKAPESPGGLEMEQRVPEAGIEVEPLPIATVCLDETPVSSTTYPFVGHRASRTLSTNASNVGPRRPVCAQASWYRSRPFSRAWTMA
jgi:hypothetical protein